MTVKAVDQDRFVYSTTERYVLAFGFFLIAVVVGLYSTNVSFRHYFFKTAEAELYSTPIGKVVAVQGAVQRERAMDTEFNTLAGKDTLYPNDTIMTGKESGTILEFEDGSKIEMSANSLVKLAFDFDFSLAALIPKQFAAGLRVPMASPVKVKAVTKAGAPVKVYAKEEKAPVTVTPPPAPVPTVAPLALSELTPQADAKIDFTAEELRARKKAVLLSARASRGTDALTAHLFDAKTGAEISAAPMTTADAAAEKPYYAASIELDSAGEHYWEVHEGENTAEKKILAKNGFAVNPVVLAIQTLPTPTLNNRMKPLMGGKAFKGFALQWKPFLDKAPYRVTVFDAKTRKPETSLEIDSEKAVYGKGVPRFSRMYYVVEQNAGKGFTAVSKEEGFGMDFLPPLQTAPAKNASILLESLAGNPKKIFFTWTKTAFTQTYDFELSSDPKFGKPEIRVEKIKDNFLIVTSPKAGQYQWRVRGRGQDVMSAFGEASAFTISP
ncbi:MAG: hypothetical protein HYW49_03650 [Deltaproteobacteria bacterium]|nr:hypothetical protein [Deltaproteobacteria bacterium]